MAGFQAPRGGWFWALNDSKIIGERLKGSGMRWVEDGAATVATLRALYVSGAKLWDGFWSQPHRAAA